MENMFYSGQEMTWYIPQNNNLYLTSKTQTHTISQFTVI